MKIREIFDAMNVTTSNYANLHCAVKKMHDVIVRRSYQEKISRITASQYISSVYIYIKLYETFQKCDNINFKLETSI